MKASLCLAGVSSGVGKTTITLGFIAALARRGLQIQPFKAGPDYIDPTYHSLAAGRPCRNIDTWMVPSERALALYHLAMQEADLALIEGVMGVFDGFSYTEESGSTAEIAKLLGAPVLLVLDVGKMARSAGALALGYVQFDPTLNIIGFLLNRCGSEKHYQGVKTAVEDATGKPVLGWLPKDADLHIPERHLGLVPTNERGQLDAFVNHVADLIERYIDLEQVLRIIEQNEFREENSPPGPPQGGEHPDFPLWGVRRASSKPRLAVARDAAFSFYYEDNLDLLRQAGAEIVFFSPLQDETLPPHTKGIYLGGGFPEVYAAQLTQNQAIHRAFWRAYAEGWPVYAECGGFMYLTEAIIDLEGERHEMVGMIPGVMHMQPHLISLGYRVVEAEAGNFLWPPGVSVRGHEFHWSLWQPDEPISPAWHIRPRRETEATKPEGYATENIIASYVHLHFAQDLQLARNFVKQLEIRD